jgi:hypothetical protein
MDALPPGEPRDATTSRWGFAVVGTALVAGLVVGAVTAWAIGPRGPGPVAPSDTVAPVEPALEESPELAVQFLGHWERSRSATYVAVTEWHRETAAGELRQTRVLVQRPPDRVRRAGGSLSGVAGGVRYTCDELPPEALVDDRGADDTIPEEPVACQALPDTAQREFDEQVAREVELMWSYLEGTYPLYRVSRDDEGCYRLRLARTMLAPPYGARTTFCFDDASGAVSRFRIERAEGTDTEELRWVDTEVGDDDVAAVVAGTFDLTARR